MSGSVAERVPDASLVASYEILRADRDNGSDGLGYTLLVGCGLAAWLEVRPRGGRVNEGGGPTVGCAAKDESVWVARDGHLPNTLDLAVVPILAAMALGVLQERSRHDRQR
jgi:hypothetical protein